MSNVQRISLQPAYLLHQRPYQDTSVIVDIITPEYGRLALVAKGVRQAKSKLKGVLRSFQPLLISWHSRGEMGTLTRAESQGAGIALSPEILPCGFYLNELVQRLLHQHDPHLELFGQYDATLRELARLGAADSLRDDNKSLQACLRHFEISLMQLLGYALIMDHECHSNMPVRADERYVYNVDEGPVRESAITATSIPHDDMPGIAVNGTTLLALYERNLSPARHDNEVFRQAKNLMRMVLDHHLGYKPLHSRQLMTRRRKIQADVPLDLKGLERDREEEFNITDEK